MTSMARSLSKDPQVAEKFACVWEWEDGTNDWQVVTGRQEAKGMFEALIADKEELGNPYRQVYVIDAEWDPYWETWTANFDCDPIWWKKWGEE